MTICASTYRSLIFGELTATPDAQRRTESGERLGLSMKGMASLGAVRAAILNGSDGAAAGAGAGNAVFRKLMTC